MITFFATIISLLAVYYAARSQHFKNLIKRLNLNTDCLKSFKYAEVPVLASSENLDLENQSSTELRVKTVAKQKPLHNKKATLPSCTLSLQKIDSQNKLILNSYKDSAKYINYKFTPYQDKLYKNCMRIKCSCKHRQCLKNYVRFQKTYLPSILEEVAY